MSTILMIWELGGGLGHLTNLQPLAWRLRAGGHRVVLALAELNQASRLLAGFEVLQAPRRRTATGAQPLRQTRSYAELLLETGTGDDTDLLSIVSSWRSLIGMVQPDLTILDHAPLALLALRGLAPRVVLTGTGFTCPPPWTDYLDIRPWEGGYPDRLRLAELEALAAANRCLTALDSTPLERLSLLFEEVDAACLTTYPELDHFPQREHGRYVGVWPLEPEGGQGAAGWPDGRGRKIFAYLKPFGEVRGMLKALASGRRRVLAHVPGIDQAVAAGLSRPGLRVSARPVSSPDALEADIIVCNGGHYFAAESLLHGRCLVTVPLNSEQRLLAEAVARMGAGICVSGGAPRELAEAVSRVSEEPAFAAAAEGFARKYRHRFGAPALDAAVDLIGRVLAGG